MASSRYDPRQDNKKYSTPVKVVGGGGKKVKLYDIGTVDANGQYPIPSGYDGYKGFNVAVPIPEPDLGTKAITTNGTYSAEDDQLDGYSQVSVNVQQEKNTHPMQIDSNGLYDARSFGWDGFSYVEVNCSGYTHAVINSEVAVGQIVITAPYANDGTQPTPPTPTPVNPIDTSVTVGSVVVTSEAHEYRW